MEILGANFIDRDEIATGTFQKLGRMGQEEMMWDWISIPLLFPTNLAEDGYTLSHTDKKIRDFWIEHGKKQGRLLIT